MYKLTSPVIITPRLLPGVQIGRSFISIEYSDKPDAENRQVWKTYIDTPDWNHEEEELRSGANGCGGSLQEGLAAYLGFLTACAESVGYRTRNGRDGENETLFPPHVAEWAYQNSYELGMLAYELEETDGLIEEVPNAL